MNDWSWEIDGWMIVIGALCASAAALLGNFLVLRRMSLLGDAISHAILPGLAAAFILTGQRQGLVMFLGAAAVGVLTVFLTELARHYGRVDEGASIGIVFTGLFALGLILISLDVTKRVDLDASCVLYGSLELAVLRRVNIAGVSVPSVVVPLTIVLLLNAAFVIGLYRPLKISTFDPQLAAAQGVKVGLIHYSLAAFVAITAVASFESVGNILVVAMFVVPPVTAWLLTDRLAVMIVLSVVVGVAAAILGHLSAITVPTWFGGFLSVVFSGVSGFTGEAIELPKIGKSNTAGMMAVVAGLLLVMAALLAPGKGILSRGWRSLRVALKILSEDVLAAIYRAELQGQTAVATRTIRGNLLVSSVRARLVLMWLKWQRLVTESNRQLSLAGAGRRQAQNIVRSHRLWEQYLASEAGLSDRELHEGAERFEHFTDRQLRERLNAETNAPDVDPHGQPIPPEAP
jgi:manganese/zinc/iron transport system permease protein